MGRRVAVEEEGGGHPEKYGNVNVIHEIVLANHILQSVSVVSHVLSTTLRLFGQENWTGLETFSHPIPIKSWVTKLSFNQNKADFSYLKIVIRTDEEIKSFSLE